MIRIIGLIFLLFVSVIQAQSLEKKPDTEVHIPDTEVREETEIQWRDYEIPSQFPELQILDRMDAKKNEQNLKKAKEYFDLSIKIIKTARQEKELVPKQFQHYPEQYPWQIHEKEEKIRKKQNEIMAQAYQKSKIYIIKGLEELEKIQSPKVIKTDYYIHLKSNLIRHFVLTQLSLNDISGVIPLIEEYFQLKESHKEEPPPYKILAYCYQRLEQASIKSNTSEEVILEYRRNKYKNLLQYVKLKYGSQSPQYEYIKKQMDRNLIQNLMFLF
ncbi:MAG: hypothetical protein NZ853_03465 [Leptospiraceae bacterium]|nr:hypothetical protein [Leptospiraceae bacterium]MDW7975232.1 hypothetical protein [Leptospiraceae bacterium]